MSFEREKISYMVGARIRELREKRNLSQEQLALQADINPAYLGRVERGEKCPSVETVYKISKGMNMTLSELTDFSVSNSRRNEQALKRIEMVVLKLSDEAAEQLADIVERLVEFQKDSC